MFLVVYVDSLQAPDRQFALEGGVPLGCKTDDRKLLGGTYRGIIDKLDYIQDLGLMPSGFHPIVANVEGFYRLRGSLPWLLGKRHLQTQSTLWLSDDLDALSDALHARDMYLLVDIVVNPFGPANSSAAFASFNPLNRQVTIHPECLSRLQQPNGRRTVLVGRPTSLLADVDTENPRSYNVHGWIKSLVKDYDIDGLRIDTFKHIRKNFWPAFTAPPASIYCRRGVSRETPPTWLITQVVFHVLCHRSFRSSRVLDVVMGFDYHWISC